MSRVNFELTSRCNLNCSHCVRDKSIRTDLNPEVVKKVLSQIKAYGIKRMSFTGGEPLLHPAFQELTAFAAEQGFKIAFVTNGVLLPRFIKFLSSPGIKSQLEWICVSLEGPDAETNDAVRGKGSFVNAIKGIASLHSHGIPFAIKLTINSLNYRKIEDTALLAAKLGAGELQLAQLYPTPENMSAGLVLAPEKWEQVQSEALRLGDLLKINLIFCAGAYLEEKFPICAHLGMTEYYVDCRGWLRICCMLGGIAGSDSGKPELDRVADLSKTSFVDAHRKLINRINWFHQKRLMRIKNGLVSDLELYQCLACGFHFGKLDWLKEFPESAWAKMLKRAKGGQK